MKDPILEEYDQMNNTVDQVVVHFVRDVGLFKSTSTLSTYKKYAAKYEKESFLESQSHSIKFAIVYQQMRDTISSLNSELQDLEAQKQILEEDEGIDPTVLERINSEISTKQNLLLNSTQSFLNFLKSEHQGKDVLYYVLNAKAFIQSAMIMGRVLGKDLIKVPNYEEGFPPDALKRYAEYQAVFGSIDRSKKGLGKYHELRLFMRVKDDKAWTNRYLVKKLEQKYGEDVILARPNYDKGTNTKLDVSRLQDFKHFVESVPIKQAEIDDFIKKSGIKKGIEI